MILNGSVAAAGVMPGMATPGNASAAKVTTASAPHCDDMDMQQSVADSNNVQALHAAASQHAGTSSDLSTPDCCKSGFCQCACVQATATVEWATPLFLSIPTPALAVFVDSGIVATRPSRLNRPPIG